MLMEARKGSLLTVKETAQLLALHPMTVRKLIAKGRIPALQLGGKGTSIRVPVDELQAWLESEPAA
jgi:excisionase family DNA binding protein